MPKKIKVGGPATAEDIEAAYRQSTNPHDWTRLLALEMAQQGEWTLAEIARALGKHRATIARWLRAYRKGGLAALLRRGHGGREASLKPEDLEALKEGLREGRWKTAREIRKWLEEERGIHLKVWGVYYWLRKVKARHKMPRKVHKKQDHREMEAFKESIVDNLNALDIPSGRRVRIWIQDEHRYGLIGVVRRCWTLMGHQVKAPTQMRFKWSYVYGALEVTGRQSLFWYMPTVSLVCSNLFLEQIVATEPDAIHVVIWDRAGYHQGLASSDLPEQIRLLPLPPYCPELNAMEKLWDQVKRHIANKVFETLDAIEASIQEVLKPFWESPQRVWSLLGDNWLTRGVAAFLKQREGFESSV